MQFIDLKAQQLRLRTQIDERMRGVLDHGHYLQGPEVRELELALENYVGVRNAIVVGSGTEALLAALLALDIGVGDEVITTPFTFAATAEAIRLVGASPVFCDIERDTYLLDPAAVAARIGPRTRAILPVDLFGQCADHRRIQALAARHRIQVVVDAAQSFGARSHGQRSGRYGTCTITSFHPANPLGSYGDGGAVFTDDPHLAAVLRQLREHGRLHGRYERVGLNARLDTLQCAVLLVKLTVFDQELAARSRIAAEYDRRLAGHVTTPVVRRWNLSSHAQYTIETDARDRVREALLACGVPTRVYYPRPLHREQAYRDDDAHCPHAESAAARVLSLPIHAYLTASDQLRVVDAMRDARPLRRLRATG